MRDSSSLYIVQQALMELNILGLRVDAIQPESLLVEDLGLDSLRFVDLTVALEDGLGIDAFPMQEWVDEQVASGEPLTVGSLVRACDHLLAERRKATSA